MGGVSAGPERIDRYEIHGTLGAGGFGTVYRARHVVLGTEVALKVLSPQHSKEPGMVERFLREAQTAAGIGNPHIVGVSDAGVTSQGMPFLAMELLEGEDLEVRLKRQGAMQASEAIDVMLQLLEGIGAAHAARIVHRDLKPGNVFLTRGPDGQPLVKLLDFGISKVFEPGRVASLTQTGAVLGTPSYMAPEQLHDTRGVDHRADLYAAGAILFEALTGKLPYESETFADLMARVQGRAPTRLDKVLPTAPLPLVSLIDRALAPDPARRFQSAVEMRDALRDVRQIFAGTPVGFPSHAVPSMAALPGTGGPTPSPITPSPAHPSAPAPQPYLAPGPTPAPSWGVSQAPSYPSAGVPSHAMTPHPFAEPRGSGRSRGLWIGLGAAGLLLPLACVGAAFATYALSDDDDDVEPAPPAPSFVRPAPPPPLDPLRPIEPMPPPVPMPAVPPPPSDGPPVAVPIPAGADPCAVPVQIDVDCDRNFDEQIPERCETTRGREMIVVGAYEPQRSDTRVTVDIARTAAPIVLVLSAYAATDWVLRLAEGARVAEIHLVGRGSSRVVEGTPAGVQVRQGRGYPIMGWSWEGMSSDWSGQATVETAERDLRMTLRAYVGCYNPTRYSIGQSPPAN